jgi:hypothetical protein
MHYKCRGDGAIRCRVLLLSANHLSIHNVKAVVDLLIKDVSAAPIEGRERPEKDESRPVAVKTLGTFSLFSEEQALAVLDLMSALLQEHYTVAIEVIAFLRAATQKFSGLGEHVLARCFSSLSAIRISRIVRAALWLVADISVSSASLAEKSTVFIIGLLQQAVDGQVPGSASSSPQASMELGGTFSASKVLADGSYVTDLFGKSDKKTVSLKSFLFEHGSMSIPATCSSVLLKLISFLEESPETSLNRIKSTAALVLVRCLRLYSRRPVKINPDAIARISLAIRVLTQGDAIPAIQINEEKKLLSSLSEKYVSGDLFTVPDFPMVASLSKSTQSLDDQLEAICGSTKFSVAKPSKLDQVFQLSGKKNFQALYFYILLRFW